MLKILNHKLLGTPNSTNTIWHIGTKEILNGLYVKISPKNEDPYNTDENQF